MKKETIMLLMAGAAAYFLLRGSNKTYFERRDEGGGGKVIYNPPHNIPLRELPLDTPRMPPRAIGGAFPHGNITRSVPPGMTLRRDGTYSGRDITPRRGGTYSEREIASYERLLRKYKLQVVDPQIMHDSTGTSAGDIGQQIPWLEKKIPELEAKIAAMKAGGL